MCVWGVTAESQFVSQLEWECSGNSRKRKKSAVTAFSSSFVVSPSFQQQPQHSDGIGNIIKSQISNKRKRLPKPKPKSKAHPTVTPDGEVVSPYFLKNNEGVGEVEGGIAIIRSNKKVKKVKVKAQALSNKRLVSPYFPHGKNDIVVASKYKTEASLDFQPQQVQSPRPSKKQRGDNASMNKRRLVSPYFRHEIDDIVVESKFKKKEKNDAYLRKSPDNAWIPPKSVHALLQEKYYEDPWKVLVICMLLNKTQGVQAKNVIQDLFKLCPNAESATLVDIKELKKVICSLGLQNKRSKKIQVLSESYLRDDWTHVDDLPGIGKYASDAYAIFCTGNWKDVVPDDHKLVPYWEDLWKSEKIGNCCKDKGMDPES